MESSRVEDLEGAAAMGGKDGVRPVPGDREEGAALGVAGGDAGDRVGAARADAADDDPRLAANARPGFGHVCGRRLVPGRHEAHVIRLQLGEERIVTAVKQPEDRADALGFETLQQQFSAGHLSHEEQTSLVGARINAQVMSVAHARGAQP